MKIRNTLSLVFALTLICTALHADGYAVSQKLITEADFQMSVIGVHVDKFEMGLYDFDPESGQERRIRIPRAGCIEFFKNQKHKDMVLVRYYGVSYDGKDWDPEIERTVQFFKDAGYARVVLFQEYGQVRGINVIYDTTETYSKHQFIPFIRK